MGQKINPLIFRSSIFKNYKNINFKVNHIIFYNIYVYYFFLNKFVNIGQICKTEYLSYKLILINFYLNIALFDNLESNNKKQSTIENFLFFNKGIKQFLKYKYSLNILINFNFINQYIYNAFSLTSYIQKLLKQNISIKKLLEHIKLNLNYIINTLFCNGIKIEFSGRLQGVLLAKTECYMLHGTVSLQSHQTYVDYHMLDIFTKNGVIGIKV